MAHVNSPDRLIGSGNSERLFYAGSELADQLSEAAEENGLEASPELLQAAEVLYAFEDAFFGDHKWKKAEILQDKVAQKVEANRDVNPVTVFSFLESAHVVMQANSDWLTATAGQLLAVGGSANTELGSAETLVEAGLRRQLKTITHEPTDGEVRTQATLLGRALTYDDIVIDSTAEMVMPGTVDDGIIDKIIESVDLDSIVLAAFVARSGLQIDSRLRTSTQWQATVSLEQFYYPLLGESGLKKAASSSLDAANRYRFAGTTYEKRAEEIHQQSHEAAAAVFHQVLKAIDRADIDLAVEAQDLQPVTPRVKGIGSIAAKLYDKGETPESLPRASLADEIGITVVIQDMGNVEWELQADRLFAAIQNISFIAGRPDGKAPNDSKFHTKIPGSNYKSLTNHFGYVHMDERGQLITTWIEVNVVTDSAHRYNQARASHLSYKLMKSGISPLYVAKHKQYYREEPLTDEEKTLIADWERRMDERERRVRHLNSEMPGTPRIASLLRLAKDQKYHFLHNRYPALSVIESMFRLDDETSFFPPNFIEEDVFAETVEMLLPNLDDSEKALLTRSLDVLGRIHRNPKCDRKANGNNGFEGHVLPVAIAFLLHEALNEDFGTSSEILPWVELALFHDADEDIDKVLNSMTNEDEIDAAIELEADFRELRQLLFELYPDIIPEGMHLLNKRTISGYTELSPESLEDSYIARLINGGNFKPEDILRLNRIKVNDRIQSPMIDVDAIYSLLSALAEDDSDQDQEELLDDTILRFLYQYGPDGLKSKYLFRFTNTFGTAQPQIAWLQAQIEGVYKYMESTSSD